MIGGNEVRMSYIRESVTTRLPPGTPTRWELVRPISVLHAEKIPPFSLTFTLKRPLFLRKRWFSGSLNYPLFSEIADYSQKSFPYDFSS